MSVTAKELKNLNIELLSYSDSSNESVDYIRFDEEFLDCCDVNTFGCFKINKKYYIGEIALDDRGELELILTPSTKKESKGYIWGNSIS